MFPNHPRRAAPVELVGEFTDEEVDCIIRLRRQFCVTPICFRLDINARRLEFARWLVDRGYLGEWPDADNDDAYSAR